MPVLSSTNIKTYAVHDHWTDINKKNDVDIMSVNGVITEIKVNGEDAGGGGGSSDFSTAEVTLSTSGFGSLPIASILDDKIDTTVPFFIESFEAILYKGSQVCDTSEITGTITVSGDAVYDSDEQTITITGDCNITIS